MTPLLPTHAVPFFGPDPQGQWGGVPWAKGAAVHRSVAGLVQRPWGGALALFDAANVVIGSGTVDDDCDGPGGSVDIDPDYCKDTSLRWPGGTSIDSRRFRGMVMHEVVEQMGGELGDFGLCCWGGIIHAVQYADIGPRRKFQEGFEKTLRDFGVIAPGQSSRHAAVAGNAVQDFSSLIFLGSAPKSEHGQPYAVPQNEMIRRALALWDAFTGRAATNP